MAFTCEFSSRGKSLGRYQAALHCNDYIRVETEELAIVLPQENGLFTHFKRSGEKIWQHVGQRSIPLKRPYTSSAPSSRTLTLREAGPDLQLPQAQALYRHITGWRFFDIVLHHARQEAFIPQYPEEVPPLANDGSNLSAFLYALWRLRPDDFDTIAGLLSEFIELPDKLLVEHDAECGGQNARYYFIEAPFGEARPIPPQSISDGTIRLLAYLALLLGDRSVSLACLEEPDHGLHPHLMLYLADILRQAVALPQDEDDFPASDGNDVNLAPQILITTHSPEFMDCFDLKEEQDYLQVYIAERDERGRTVFTLATVEEFAPWLEKYRLGEAVRRRFI